MRAAKIAGSQEEASVTQEVHYAFLHGGGQAGWVWRQTLAALDQQCGGAGYRAVAFDLPGCGQKRHVDTSHLSVRQVAEAFATELATSGLRDIILVGHSNAGTILPLTAQLLAGRVRRFIYVSCLAPAPGQSILQLMSGGTHAIGGDRTGDARSRLRAMFCNDMDEPAASDFLAELGHDKWPTRAALDENAWHYDHLEREQGTYVVCLRDQSLPPEWQQEFASRLHVQRLVRIDAGHQVMNTRPQALAEILRQEARSAYGYA
jgi:pimeloyl-ACP methyl ester carboxylesterase